MAIRDALLSIAALVGLLSAPIVYCFYKQHLDILNEIRAILLKQKSGLSMISPVEFMQLDRVVRGERRFLGKNEDVISLMFPKRYWFNCLQVVVHLAAVIAVLTLMWRIVMIDDKNATMASLFEAVNQEVHISIVSLAISLVVYLITLLMAINQKQALRRRIEELADELES